MFGILETKNQVYYDKKINRFVNLRESFKGGWMVGVAEYYSDSMTTNQTVPMTNEYVKENLEHVKDITKHARFTGHGWSTEA